MIHILIDNSTYPYAQVSGVYRDFSSALEAKADQEEVQIVSWNIVNNCVCTFGDDNGPDGGLALSAAA